MKAESVGKVIEFAADIFKKVGRIITEKHMTPKEMMQDNIYTIKMQSSIESDPHFEQQVLKPQDFIQILDEQLASQASSLAQQ